MSELNKMRDGRNDFRGNLLTSASVAALAILVFVRDAKAADENTDRPTIWIELGGQLEHTDSGQATFAPPFFDHASAADLGVMTAAQRPPAYSLGEEGKISFAPEETNWVFSASVRYGRSNAASHLHHETAGLPPEYWTFFGHLFVQYTLRPREFGDGQATKSATHLMTDFQAGKDIGLGLFGAGSRSVFSVGVRFAQFTSKADVTLHARPVNDAVKISSPGVFQLYTHPRRSYTAVFHAERNSHAIGPSLSWDASLPVTGSDNGMAVALNWGANAAVLFGRQKVKISHQTEGNYHTGYTAGNLVTAYTHGPYSHDRARTVTIPNVGGFAGLSFRYANAKLDLGYRADFFFNAIDNGIDTRKSETLGFYGPFASVSVGIGG